MLLHGNARTSTGKEFAGHPGSDRKFSQLRAMLVSRRPRSAPFFVSRNDFAGAVQRVPGNLFLDGMEKFSSKRGACGSEL
jgi:hypothetical protein